MQAAIILDSADASWLQVIVVKRALVVKCVLRVESRCAVLREVGSWDTRAIDLGRALA